MSSPLAGSSASAAKRPLISVIVPALNEERYLGAVLDDMLAQEVDADVEILVVDGGSTDGTRAIVDSYGAKAAVRLVENPKRHQVFGYNLGIRDARGSLICIVHAHARFAKTYLAALWSARTRTGAGNVGGVIHHIGETTFGEAVALAMSSPLGVGDSKYRHTTRERWCNNVMGTFIDRKLFDEVGYYNETNLANEDCEFNYRLRAAGYKILVTPAIEVTYFVRSSPLGLIKQYLRYGFYRRWTEVQHPGSVPWRVYAPPALVAGLILSALLFVAGFHILGLVLPLLYLCVLALGAVDGMRRSKRVELALLEPVAIVIMHLCFGIGWLRGFLTLRAVSEASRDGRTRNS